MDAVRKVKQEKEYKAMLEARIGTKERFAHKVGLDDKNFEKWQDLIDP